MAGLPPALLNRRARPARLARSAAFSIPKWLAVDADHLAVFWQHLRQDLPSVPDTAPTSRIQRSAFAFTFGLTPAPGRRTLPAAEAYLTT